MNTNIFETLPGGRGRLVFAHRANTLFEILRVGRNAGGTGTAAKTAVISGGHADSQNGPWFSQTARAGTAGQSDGTAWTGCEMLPASGNQHGRPAATFRFPDTTDHACILAYAAGLPFNFTNENDYVRMSLAFRSATPNDITLFAGLATVPYGAGTNVVGDFASGTVNAASIVSFFSTCMGVMKPLTAAGGAASPLQAFIADDGTATSVVQVGSNVLANEWQDLDIEFTRGATANSGTMKVFHGVETPYESEFTRRTEQDIRTSTLFPDTDATLVPVILVMASSAASASFSWGHVEVAGWRRPQR